MGYVQRLLARRENIVFATRQHWSVLLGSLIVNGLLIAAIMAAAIILSTMLAFPPALFMLALILIPLIRLVMRVVRWWNEQYIITNRRVIQVEGVINKHVIDSSLEKVNDVVLVQSVWGRLLDYGDVEILTASDVGVNRLDRLGSPVRFKTEMLNQKEGLGPMERAEQALGASSPPTAADIPELIAELDELRKKNIISDEEFENKKEALLGKIQ
jgi:uncharacterized membrane protein YdbT with pleckstrin-like domain